MRLAQGIESSDARLDDFKLAQDLTSTDAILQPETPVLNLTVPSNGATDVAVGTTFEWTDSDNRDVYKVVYDTDELFSNPTVGWTETTTFTPDSDLSASTEYFWYVEAHTVTQQDVIVTPTTGLDSQAGDITALEALATSTSADVDLTGWATSGMTLDPAPQGVTVATIGGELRVTEIDIRNNGLTGNINIPEWENLKQCTLINVMFNALNSAIPQELVSLGEQSLEYLYLCGSDNKSPEILSDQHPHETINSGTGYVHPGKNKGSEQNVFTGEVPASSTPANNNLKWFMLNWTDSTPSASDGVSSINSSFWDISTFEGLLLADNYNIATITFPTAVYNMTSLSHFYLSRGDFVNGSVGSNFGNLVNLQHFLLDNQRNLIFDFDVVDISGFNDLRTIYLSGSDIRGSLPNYLWDGRFPNLDAILLSGFRGEKMNGTMEPVSATSSGISTFTISWHNLTGSIHPSLYTSVPGNVIFGLDRNDWTSIGSTDLTMLTKVRNFNINDCNIRNERWPAFNWGNVSDFSRFNAQRNYYVFRDMLYIPNNAPAGETCFELIQTEANVDFNYSPQKPFGFETALTGNIIDFSGDVSHPDNVYLWEKDGVTVSGETSSSIDTTSTGAGDYQLFVTNPGVSGLTLESITITVE